MVTLAGIRLSMCTKPQQTAEMNTSYWGLSVLQPLDDGDAINFLSSVWLQCLTENLCDNR